MPPLHISSKRDKAQFVSTRGSFGSCFRSLYHFINDEMEPAMGLGDLARIQSCLGRQRTYCGMLGRQLYSQMN
jgi:hypothetical protein